MSRLVLLLLFTAPLAADPVAYAIDPASSWMEVVIGRSGLLAKLSHRVHVRSRAFGGRVVADRDRLGAATVEIDVDATELTIVGNEFDHDDQREAQRYMRGKRCLDVKQFPKITFRSNRVRVSPRQKDSAHLLVNGYFDLHGTTRELEVPVDVRFTETGLEAEGAVTFRQSDFQIHPWKDLLGLIEVPDAVTVEFKILAPRAK